jgi:hypothetical protein
VQIIVTIDLPGETKRPADLVLAARLHEVANRIADGVAAGDFRGPDGERAGQFDVQTRA